MVRGAPLKGRELSRLRVGSWGGGRLDPAIRADLEALSSRAEEGLTARVQRALDCDLAGSRQQYNIRIPGE